jgi:hypothetical protein
MKLLEIKSTVRYIKPDLDDEYDEVLYRPELRSYFKDKKSWLKVARTGKETTLSGSDLNRLVNHDPEFKNLEKVKTERVASLFSKGTVELPIVLKDDKFLHLLAGNTRLAYAREHKYPLKVWMINAPDLESYF